LCIDVSGKPTASITKVLVVGFL